MGQNYSAIMHYGIKNFESDYTSLVNLFKGILNAILSIAWEWKIINKYEQSSANDASKTNVMNSLLI